MPPRVKTEVLDTSETIYCTIFSKLLRDDLNPKTESWLTELKNYYDNHDKTFVGYSMEMKFIAKVLGSL